MASSYTTVACHHVCLGYLFGSIDNFARGFSNQIAGFIAAYPFVCMVTRVFIITNYVICAGFLFHTSSNLVFEIQRNADHQKDSVQGTA